MTDRERDLEALLVTVAGRASRLIHCLSNDGDCLPPETSRALVSLEDAVRQATDHIAQAMGVEESAASELDALSAVRNAAQASLDDLDAPQPPPVDGTAEPTAEAPCACCGTALEALPGYADHRRCPKCGYIAYRQRAAAELAALSASRHAAAQASLDDLDAPQPPPAKAGGDEDWPAPHVAAAEASAQAAERPGLPSNDDGIY